MKQIDRVLNQLKKEGIISRNYYLDLPFGEKITRLSSIIERLRTRGYKITSYEEGHDFMYRLDLMPDGKVPVRVEYEKVLKNGEWVVLKKEIPLNDIITPPTQPILPVDEWEGVSPTSFVARVLKSL